MNAKMFALFLQLYVNFVLGKGKFSLMEMFLDFSRTVSALCVISDPRLVVIYLHSYDTRD